MAENIADDLDHVVFIDDFESGDPGTWSTSQGLPI
jgi:hypothetical protein